MIINISVLKGELNGKIVVVRFFFCRVYYDFRLNSYIEKGAFQDFSNIKALGPKFGLAVIKIKVNPDSSFVQTW